MTGKHRGFPDRDPTKKGGMDMGLPKPKTSTEEPRRPSPRRDPDWPADPHGCVHLHNGAPAGNCDRDGRGWFTGDLEDLYDEMRATLEEFGEYLKEMAKALDIELCPRCTRRVLPGTYHEMFNGNQMFACTVKEGERGHRWSSTYTDTAGHVMDQCSCGKNFCPKMMDGPNLAPKW